MIVVQVTAKLASAASEIAWRRYHNRTRVSQNPRLQNPRLNPRIDEAYILNDIAKPFFRIEKISCY